MVCSGAGWFPEEGFTLPALCGGRLVLAPHAAWVVAVGSRFSAGGRPHFHGVVVL